VSESDTLKLDRETSGINREECMFNGSIYVRSKSNDDEGNGKRKRTRRTINKPRRLPPEVLTDEEVAKLMRACSHRAPTGIRNRALIALLYRSGLRINEALSLFPKDLELEKGSIRVLNGKGGRSRTIGIDPGATAIVQRWLDARSRLKVDSTGKPNQCANGRHPVFCTLDGQSMSASYVRVMLKRLAFKAGIDKRVHAHGFRHTHAAQLRAEGVDIAIISRQLGHTSITTTARYLDHIAPTAVIETMRSRSWTVL
jgi:site-specific recombinase XerD